MAVYWNWILMLPKLVLATLHMDPTQSYSTFTNCLHSCISPKEQWGITTRRRLEKIEGNYCNCCCEVSRVGCQQYYNLFPNLIRPLWGGRHLTTPLLHCTTKPHSTTRDRTGQVNNRGEERREKGKERERTVETQAGKSTLGEKKGDLQCVCEREWCIYPTTPLNYPPERGGQERRRTIWTTYFLRQIFPLSLSLPFSPSNIIPPQLPQSIIPTNLPLLLKLIAYTEMMQPHSFSPNQS